MIKDLIRVSLFAVGAALIPLCGCAARQAEPSHAQSMAQAHWSYEGEHGPDHWAELPDCDLCGKGQAQSPINITKPVRRDLPDIQFKSKPTAVGIVNNGHTIQVNCAPGSAIELEGVTYNLAQFHFHAPSEHTINGKGAPAELHLVHKSEKGELAVLGVLIEEGAENPNLAALWTNLPQSPGPEIKLPITIDENSLIPSDHRTIRYAGSLTTPPCGEGVHWNVFVKPITMSKEQLDAFTRLYSGNNRPVQELHGRQVMQDTVAK